MNYSGNGTSIYVSSLSSATSSTHASMDAIGGLLSFDRTPSDAPDVDTTVLATTAFGTQEKGIPMPPSATMSVRYAQANAGVNKLLAYERSRKVAKFAVSFASTALREELFLAYVKGVGMAIARDTMMTRSISIGFSSGPSWTT